MINKQFHCFSLKLAGYLMLRSFVLFEIQECKDSRRKIYMFKDSDLLRKAVEDFKLDKHKYIK